MNLPRLILAIVVGFVVIMGSDMLIHGLWLKPDYEATKAIWRPESEMESRMMWMFIAQILCAITFVVIWAKGFAGRSPGTGALFGLLMGVFQGVWTIILYVVMPLPSSIPMKWFLVGIIQCMLLGIAAALVYKPAAPGISAS